MEANGGAVAVKGNSKRCSCLDVLLLSGAALGLVVAVVYAIFVYVPHLQDRSWKRGDSCYVDKVEVVPREAELREKRGTHRRSHGRRPPHHDGGHGRKGHHSHEEWESREDEYSSEEESREDDDSESRNAVLTLLLEKLQKDTQVILQGAEDTYLASKRRNSEEEMKSSEEDRDGSKEEEDEEMCSLMPCAKVWVSFGSEHGTGNGLLHPNAKNLEENKLCSLSPCDDDTEEVQEDIREFIHPYAKAMIYGESVECFYNKHEQKNLWQQFTCDTRDSWNAMTGWDEEEKEDADDMDNNEHSLDKRSVDLEEVSHVIAFRRFSSPCSVLGIMIPTFATLICLLVFTVRRVVILVKSTKVTERRDPYAVNRGPSFVGKQMRSPSVWSLTSNWSNSKAKEAWGGKDEKNPVAPSPPPVYDNAKFAAPAYEEAMNNAPPSYEYVNEQEKIEEEVEEKE